MKKLIVDLEHCYGIKKLKHVFDFSDHRAYAIYAPNGAMKSSFAQTFKDVADGTESRDRVFPDRKCHRTITDENGTPLPGASVLVIRPYDEVFGHTEQTSTLLVDSTLRKEYEQLHADINKSKDAFLNALKAQSGSKKDLEAEISSTFTKTDTEFYRALLRVEAELAAQNDAPFANIPYDIIYDDKVLSFLATGDSKTAIDEYIRRYNELLAASTYFKQGVFNYYNAATIAKNLADNGFFDAQHTVHLNAATTLEITTQKQLEDLIAQEKETITTDKALRKKFDQIDKLLNKNVQLRDFRNYVAQHEELLTRLANIEQFREDVWKSYFKAHNQLYVDLVAQVKRVDQSKQEIEREAAKQRTQWENVIDIFNNRFFVPFKLTANNRVSVILGQEPMLSLGFTFEDGADRATVDKGDLMKVLSTGERKALYVLNIIFEIEVRRKLTQPTIFVVDDIADSFDYKNKYAIVQYLKEIAEDPHFNLIILTHNFDFFRTVNSRFVKYSHCLMAFRDNTGLSLSQASGIKNVFVNDWKKFFFSDPKKKLASIPFIRNIIEYTEGEEDPDFSKLTSLLHWKPDSESILERDLDAIYKRTFGNAEGGAKNGQRVLDIVWKEAKECLTAGESINFENKIVLSIAIRMAAERFMIQRISDPAFVESIVAHQTSRLFERFRQQFPDEAKAIEALERVVLMTPENIHLNSFMYEPILDMSDEHLRGLYRDILALSRDTGGSI